MAEATTPPAGTVTSDAPGQPASADLAEPGDATSGVAPDPAGVRAAETDDAEPYRRAAPLAERVAHADPRPDAERRARAEALRQRWRASAPFGRAGTPGAAGRLGHGARLWRRRLAAAGLDEPGLLAVLATDGGPDPEWAADLRAAYGAPVPPRAEWPVNDPELPFFGLVEPLVGWLRRRLLTRVPPLGRDRLPAPERLVDLLLRGLLPRLNAMVQRTCLLELAACRNAGLLTGATPQDRFASFQRRLRDPAYRRRLLTRYPVLARQLAVTGRLWTRQALEFLTRLDDDLPELVRTFSPDRDPGTVVEIVTGLGDPHRGARSVAMLRFASGLRVMYKPRPAALDTHFQSLLSWLNARTPGPRFRVLRCLDRGRYGWMEYVQPAPPADAAALRRYHRRQGGLLALLYLLHAGDVHAENLIPAGDQPVLVDLETLFQPALPALRPTGESAAERLAADLASGSVLHTGLLPGRPSPWGAGRAGMAAGGSAPHRAAVRLPTIADAGTERMRVELTQPDEPAGPAGSGDPVGRGADGLRVSEHVPDVVTGFTEVYRVLLAHREDLAAPHGPLAAFATDEVRVLVRDTMTYAMLLGAAFHPGLLVDGLDRERHFDRLWSEVTRRPGLAAFTEAERRDLWQGDIPVFTTGVAGGPVRDSRGAPVPDVPVVPGLRIVRDILARLGPADLARQLWLIRACVAVNGVRREQRFLFPRYPTEPAEAPAPDTRLATAAAAIADRLAGLAVRQGGTAAWIGAQFGVHRTCAVGVLGPNLPDGLLGIALFLARYADLTGDPAARRLARHTTRTAVAQIRRGLLGRVLGLAGLGGAVYGLSHLGVLWADDRLLREADRLIEELAGRLASDRQFEVMEGAAGALFGLVARYRAGPDGRLRDLLARTADHLVTAQRPYGSGASWLPAELVDSGLADRPLAGFAHGTAGIAAALLAAADILDDGTCRTAAERGFDYEQDLFDPRKGGWRDLRDHTRTGAIDIVFEDGSPDRPDRPVAWCHGAPGVGVARLAALAHPGLAGGAAARTAELTAAVADTLRAGFGNGHSLCHGDLGSLDFLQLVADRTTDDALRERVRRQTTTVLDTVDRSGWHCGLHRDIAIPGLLTGLAGIGYGLLRLLAPDRVPSVLAQQPPG